MRFARIRGGVQAEGLRAASNEQSSFGLIRGGLFHVSTPNLILSELNPHKHRVTPILRKIRSKNKKKKKDYSAVSFFGRSGFTYVIS